MLQKQKNETECLKLMMVTAIGPTCVAICFSHAPLFNEGNKKRIYIIEPRPITDRQGDIKQFRKYDEA